MVSPAAKAELMRALGRLVRGLSTLFWGLPIALVIFGLLWLNTVSASGPNALTEWLLSLNVLPPLAATGLLLYGLIQLQDFQQQERVWQQTLDRAILVACVNFGLSPFLHWWNQVPAQPYFAATVSLLMLCSLLFLAHLNLVLNRLAAMLPDETLRVETRFFTSLNLCLLALIAFLLMAYVIIFQLPALPVAVVRILRAVQIVRQWFLLFFLLIPVAMTMTLIWKIKEVILHSLFESPEPWGRI